MRFIKMGQKYAVVLLALLSIAVHFAWIGSPSTTVFDEIHFGKFISAYFTHEYYFDIHPPLGKLILAGWGKLWGFRPGFSFANIGDPFPDRAYIALRFLPSLAGALLPLVIYAIARQLKLSRTASLTAGVLIALDNALLVQSRLILLDSFLLLFGFTSFYCYLRWRNGGPRWLLLATGILSGAAVGIKWTGATFLALILILELIHLWQDRHTTARQRLLPLIGALVIAPFAVYYASFAVHFALLTHAGTGDAFMTPRFQHDLVGNAHANDPELKSLSSLGKFAELNIEMYLANQRLTASHPYSSKWYTWPFMQRPIFYWIKDNARIYLIGNPVVWWASTVALAVLLLDAMIVGIRRIGATPLMLLGVWFMNMLPFIGINRVMFLYHYFIALIWAVLMLAWLLDRSPQRKRIALGLTLLSLATFLFFSPLSYGSPLPGHSYDIRVWLPSWR